MPRKILVRAHKRRPPAHEESRFLDVLSDADLLRSGVRRVVYEWTEFLIPLVVSERSLFFRRKILPLKPVFGSILLVSSESIQNLIPLAVAHDRLHLGGQATSARRADAFAPSFLPEQLAPPLSCFAVELRFLPRSQVAPDHFSLLP